MRNALVPLAPAAPKDTGLRPGRRPNADFVAHLIATKEQAPQTRARRRAEPEQAIMAYGALGRSPTLPPGRILKRSL